MKTKVILFLSGVLFSAGFMHAQANQDCARTASLAYTDAKAGNYDAAYPRIQELREECPEYNVVTYQYGERILKDKLENAPEGEKQEIAKDLIKLYRERLEYFPGKTDEAKIKIDIAQIMDLNNIGTSEEQFQAYKNAWEEDKESFTSPRALYGFFSLLVDLQDAGERDLQDVFNLYDEVIAKIEQEENKMAENLAILIEKQESGEELADKEEKRINAYEVNLNAYNTVKNSINAKLGQRADCENLIPLYRKDFEERKTDVEWLRNANARLSSKDCVENPLFVEISEALHRLEPSANSAYSLGQLAEAEGDRAKALEYYNEAAELQDDPSTRARIYYRIANNYKERGQFSQARTYYNRALQARPSMGRAYLQIADMYRASANDCGETTFEKRAVYWLAAEYAERAGRVDPSISSTANQAVASYRGMAPQRSDIFQEDMQGKTINIGCWINESVRVPNL